MRCEGTKEVTRGDNCSPSQLAPCEHNRTVPHVASVLCLEVRITVCVELDERIEKKRRGELRPVGTFGMGSKE